MKDKILSVFIFITVWILVFLMGYHAVRAWIHNNNNLEYVYDKTHPCKKFVTEIKPKKVVYRIDDVQAYAYTNEVVQIIKDLNNKKIHAVLGIIPKGLDQDILMEKVLKRNSCNYEYAVHGWDHSVYAETQIFEFDNISNQEAALRVKNGINMIKKVTKQTPVTFIPPGNKLGDEAKSAVLSAGIHTISGASQGDLDMSIATYDYESKTLISNEEIINTCTQKFEQNKICVIVVHPQDYMTNDKIDFEKYKKFTELVDTLQSSDASAVRFSDL